MRKFFGPKWLKIRVYLSFRIIMSSKTVLWSKVCHTGSGIGVFHFFNFSLASDLETRTCLVEIYILGKKKIDQTWPLGFIVAQNNGFSEFLTKL